MLQSVEELLSRQPSEDEITETIPRVAGMMLIHGGQQKIEAPNCPERVEPMPFTLFPSAFPRQLLEESQSLQPYFQSLIYKVANDHEFLQDCLKDILKVDDFTRELWNIYQTVREEGLTQDITVFVARNDFMLQHCKDDNSRLQLKQVEFNTFASGAGGVISALSHVHKYSLALMGMACSDEQLPYNHPVKGYAKGLVKAKQLYDKERRAAILFVVQVPEPNTPDQRWLEKEIHDCLDPTVTVIYRTFIQLMEQAKLGEKNILLVDGFEVAVVYFRTGYTPGHYPTAKEYALRLLIERSRAIKCPSVALHLAGCKKVQQVLSKPGILERFIDDKEVVERLRSTFVGQFVLNPGDEGDANFAMALKTPEKYVLKPQREGGGNNYFDDELTKYLQNMKNTSERSSWILMERIQAFRHENRLIRVGLGPEKRHVNSELGVFGVHISTPTQELTNYSCGYLLRTKPENANEAGLFKGTSCLDSPYLV